MTDTFAWRGRRIVWSVRGTGPDLVLCHGTPWSSRLWEPFAEAMAPRFRVHLWDMPGYGASSKDQGHDVDLATQSEAFAAFLADRGLHRPHVVAHDIGGAIVLRSHLLDGVDLASLALVDVVALRPWGSDFFRTVRAHPEVFAGLPAALHRGLVQAYIAGASSRGLAPDALSALVEPWLGEQGQAAFVRQIVQADEQHTADFEDLLGEVRCPVHIVWGEDDAWIPLVRAHHLHDAIPASTLATIAGAGHLIQLDQPVPLAVELERWLARNR